MELEDEEVKGDELEDEVIEGGKGRRGRLAMTVVNLLTFISSLPYLLTQQIIGEDNWGRRGRAVKVEDAYAFRPRVASFSFIL